MNTFVKKITLIFFAAVCAFSANAQKWELGLGVGSGNYAGDIRHFNVMESGVGINILGRYNYSNTFSFKSNITFLNTKGSDDISDRPLPEYRQYAFSTQILELSGVAEYNFLDFREGSNVFTPYFMGGLAFYRFNSQIEDEDGVGQYGLSIPFGMGLKYAISRNMNASLEAGTRATFTDMIDGVSEDTDPDIPGTNQYTGDWYYYINLSITYLFHTIDCPDDAPMDKK